MLITRTRMVRYAWWLGSIIQGHQMGGEVTKHD